MLGSRYTSGMKKKRRARMHRAEIEFSEALWRKLRHAAVDLDTSASELARRGVHFVLAYVKEHGELPPARAGLARNVARAMGPREPGASPEVEPG